MLFTLSVVHLQSCVQLFATPWAAACQASLSSTVSWSLSIESVMPFNHLMLYHPFLLLPSILLSIRVFSKGKFSSSFFTIGSWSIGASASVLMNIQGWFPLGLTGFISLQSKGLKSSAAQFESINSSALNLPYGQLSHSHTTTRETITDYMDLCQQSDVPAF